MEAQKLASDESVSSGPCMDFQLNFNNIQNNHETTSANSSNVGLGLLGASVEDGAVHLQQHSYHQIHQNSHPNNSGFGNFSPLGDLSLSLKMRSASANPHRINITHQPSLFPYHNLPARASSTTNTTIWQLHPHGPFRLQFSPTNLPYHDDQPAKPKFNRKRARDGALMHCIVRECSSQPAIHIKGGIGNYGRMKNQSTHVTIAKKKNPSDGRLTNSVYDITFEEVGLPIDPHLRLFFPL